MDMLLGMLTYNAVHIVNGHDAVLLAGLVDGLLHRQMRAVVADGAHHFHLDAVLLVGIALIRFLGDFEELTF